MRTFVHKPMTPPSPYDGDTSPTSSGEAKNLNFQSSRLRRR
jgi:hypothetical protein